MQVRYGRPRPWLMFGYMAKNPSLTQQRFAVIESLMLWEGEVSNRRLRQLLGLQPVQVSRLIAAYRQTVPQGLKLDTRNKRFVAVPEFKPTFASGTAHEYGHWVLETKGGFLGIEDARVELAEVAPKVFAALR